MRISILLLFFAIQAKAAYQPVTQVSGTVTVSGSVNVANFPASQTVSGSISVSNFPSVQVVSAGTVAISAASLPTHAVTQSGGPWSVSSTGVAEVNLANSRSNSFPFLIGGVVNGSLQSVSMTSAQAIRVDLSSTGQNLTPLIVSTTGTVATSLVSVPTHAVTQSGGPWSVSSTGTIPVVFPSVPVVSAGTVAVTVSTIPTHAVTQSGAWSTLVTNSLGIASGTLTSISSGISVSNTVGVSAGTVVVSQATATNLKVQAEAYQGGSAVSSSNPLAVSSTNVVPSILVPGSNSSNALSNSDNGPIPKVSVKASAGRMFLLTGFNVSGTGQYLMIFDSATQPAVNTKPTIAPVYMPPFSNYSYDFGTYGKYFSSGIYIANSTSSTAYVNGTSETWINALYQ